MVASFAAATPTLQVTPSLRNVTQSAGSTTFNVFSNTSWTANSDATWCCVTPSGSGDGIIKVTYQSNAEDTQRIGGEWSGGRVCPEPAFDRETRPSNFIDY